MMMTLFSSRRVASSTRISCSSSVLLLHMFMLAMCVSNAANIVSLEKNNADDSSNNEMQQSFPIAKQSNGIIDRIVGSRNVNDDDDDDKLCYPDNDCFDFYTTYTSKQLLTILHDEHTLMHEIDDCVRWLEYHLQLPVGTLPTPPKPDPIKPCEPTYRNAKIPRFMRKLRDTYVITNSLDILSNAQKSDFTNLGKRILNVVAALSRWPDPPSNKTLRSSSITGSGGVSNKSSSSYDGTIFRDIVSVSTRPNVKMENFLFGSSSDERRRPVDAAGDEKPPLWCYTPGDCIAVEVSKNDLMIEYFDSVFYDQELELVFYLMSVFDKFHIDVPPFTPPYPKSNIDDELDCKAHPRPGENYVYDTHVDDARHVAYSARRLQEDVRNKLLHCAEVLQILIRYVNEHPQPSGGGVKENNKS